LPLLDGLEINILGFAKENEKYFEKEFRVWIASTYLLKIFKAYN
jgi:hypothetical protein